MVSGLEAFESFRPTVAKLSLLAHCCALCALTQVGVWVVASNWVGAKFAWSGRREMAFAFVALRVSLGTFLVVRHVYLAMKIQKPSNCPRTCSLKQCEEVEIPPRQCSPNLRTLAEIYLQPFKLVTRSGHARWSHLVCECPRRQLEASSPEDPSPPDLLSILSGCCWQVRAYTSLCRLVLLLPTSLVSVRTYLLCLG